MVEQWFLARAKTKYGPYSTAQMREFATKGQLLPIDMVMQEGTAKWLPASQINGLFPATPPVAVPPPVPSSRSANPPSAVPAKGSPPAGPAPWYYSRSGEQHGPFTTAQLKQLPQTGELQPTDSIWKEGMPKWRPASEVKGLFDKPEEKRPAPHTVPTKPSNDQRMATWVFGSILLTFFLGVFLFAPAEMPEFKQRMLAFSSAILAGLFGFFFTGAIHLELKTVKKLFGDLGVKATGGSALFVLVLVWWLSPLAPVKSSLALKAIHFSPETNQVTVFSKDVQTILYSFDGKTWKQAEVVTLNKQIAFEGVAYSAAKLNPQEKRAHTEVYIKYVTTAGRESKAQKFTYDPDKSFEPAKEAGERARKVLEKVGKARDKSKESMNEARERVRKAMDESRKIGGKARD